MNPEEEKAFLQSQLAQKDQMIQSQIETIKALQETIEMMAEKIAGLQETVNEFQRKLFGTSSERTKEKSGSAESEGSAPITVKSHTRTKKAKTTREDQYGNLPIHKVVIPLSEQEQKCPYCNSQMKQIGETYVREELRITPAKVERIHYYQEKWICPACKKDGDGTFLESKIPDSLIPHSPASPSIVAYIILEKAGLALPYYRQEYLMKQLGFTLPRETMANWVIYCELCKKVTLKSLHGFKNVITSSRLLPLLRYASMIASASCCRFCS